MKTIGLTKGFQTIVDDADFELYGGQNWHYSHGYAAQKTQSGMVYLHRLILGESLDEVDHINGDSLDNRKVNLRFATHAENNMNKALQSNSTTGFCGVHRLKATGKFQAYIKKDSKRIHLGTYDTAKDAARAYCAVAEILFGDYRRIKK